MTTGERIKIRREELGMSKAELAKKMGYSRSAITKLERRDTVNPSKIVELAQALNTTVSYLIEEKEPYDELTQKAIKLFVKLDHIDQIRTLERMATYLDDEKYKRN